MAPMLEDEIMHDAEKMNSKVAGIARTGKQIYDFIEQLKAKNTAPGISDNSLPFSFSGQITDLSYFNTNDILPKEVIDSIPDAELKEAVISNLELAEKQGLIDVDLNNGKVIELFNLSPSQSSYLKTGEKGTGLIVSGKKIIPFDRRISKDSSIYNLCQTDFRRDVT